MAGHYSEDDEGLGSNNRRHLRYHRKILIVSIRVYSTVRQSPSYLYQSINSVHASVYCAHGCMHACMHSYVTKARMNTLCRRRNLLKTVGVIKNNTDCLYGEKLIIPMHAVDYQSRIIERLRCN